MKKGFTLVELLAVIVVIAIVSLVAIPKLTNVINTSRKNAAVVSAGNYIHAVETMKMINDLSSESEINDGIYEVGSLNVKVKGTRPKKGVIKVQNGKVVDAKFCINDYSIDYNNDIASLSDNNYCDNLSGNVVVYENDVALSSTKTSNMLKTYTIDTNNNSTVTCLGGAVPIVSGNQLAIIPSKENVQCYVGNNLAYAFDHADKTKTTIEVFKDNESTKSATINDYKNIVLNMHNYKSTFNNAEDKFAINVAGKLIINSDDGSLVTNHVLFYINTTGDLQLNGGKYLTTSLENNAKNTNLIYNLGNITINKADISYKAKILPIYNNSNLVINDGNFTSELTSVISTFNGTTTINNGTFTSNAEWSSVITSQSVGNVIINGGTFKALGTNHALRVYGENAKMTVNNANAYSEAGQALNVENGTLIVNNVYARSNKTYTLKSYGKANLKLTGGVFISDENNAFFLLGDSNNEIEQKKPIYISTLNKVDGGKTAFVCQSTKKIVIKADKADKCTNNYNDTKKGLCVYAEGNKDYTSNLSQIALANYTASTVSIDGGTYFGGYIGIQNGSSGIINIKNAEVKSVNRDIYNNSGKIYMCNSTLDPIEHGEIAGGDNSKYFYKNIIINGKDKVKSVSAGTVDPNYSGNCNEGLEN